MRFHHVAPLDLTYRMNEANRGSGKKRLLLGGYFSSMRDQDAKKRYLDKLRVIGGVDPYETEKDWKTMSTCGLA